MKQYKAGIVAFSFSRDLPPYFQVFLKSCADNPKFNWLFFTDADTADFAVPDNVEVIKRDFADIQILVKEKIGDPSVNIDLPYKLCDYKPLFGLIFEDYLKDYDFFGYCDIDVVFGSLNSFITDGLLEKYDKIYSFGHLSLIRNTPPFRSAFLAESANSTNWKDVFFVPNARSFDEKSGINEKIIESGGKLYKEIEYIDRSIFHRRFTMVCKKEVDCVFKEATVTIGKYPKNYTRQIAGVKDGHAYLFYCRGKKVKRREVSYIHFRSNPKVCIGGDTPNYYITADKIFPMDGEPTRELMERENPFLSKKIEREEFISLATGRFKMDFSWKGKAARTKKKLASVPFLRKIVHKLKGIK